MINFTLITQLIPGGLKAFVEWEMKYQSITAGTISWITETVMLITICIAIITLISLTSV